MKRLLSFFLLFSLILGVFSLTAAAEAKEKPVYADSINDGTYGIEVKSSSSMFRIIDCQLTVRGGEMTAVMTLSGTGYEKVFLGTREEADNASDGEFSYFAETDGGRYCYEIPVEALDKELSCAAFSIRKQKWYDRTLVFQSETLPGGALKFNPVPVIIISAVAVLMGAAVVTGIVKSKRKRGE